MNIRISNKQKEYLQRSVEALFEYISYIEKKFPASVSHIKAYELPFWDFAWKHLKNIKGCTWLLHLLIEDGGLKIPLGNVLRSMMADSLTNKYLLLLLKLDPSGKTVTNEINCFEGEYAASCNSIGEIEHFKDEIEPPLESINYKGKLKNRAEIHAADDLPDYLKIGKMLSENMKFKFIQEKAPQDEVSEECFKLNKFFSQYYHYSITGAEIGRTFSDDEMYFIGRALGISMEVFKDNMEIISNSFPQNFMDDWNKNAMNVIDVMELN